MFIPKATILITFASALVTTHLAPAQTAPGTTTTIQAVPSSVPAQTSTSTTITTSAGMVSELAPDALIISTDNAATPIRYISSSSTVFVDETGVPVSRELVTRGLPVTVHYTRSGDRLIADRVVVRRQTSTTTTTPTVIEKNTTITPPPVVVEKPVYVDRPVDRPVVVEKKVPVVVEKKVYVDRPVVVEKPVIVEKPVAAPVVNKTTTTTTTTTKKDD